MITIATHLWDPNDQSFSFSRMYDEGWVEKLYRGVARNITQPFRFICWSEKPRWYSEPIETRLLDDPEPGYGSCVQLFELGEPMIVMGLDTVITGNIDHLADYCLTASKIALPRDPNAPYRACNGICLVPAGMQHIWTNHNGENDMAWMRRQPHEFIDDIFPGAARSFKGGESVPGIRETGLGDTRIVYFHGFSKPHELDDDWLKEHWV